MTSLKTLADARSEILKAEVAAVLHNLGKCSGAFIGQMTGTPLGYEDFRYQYITGIVADWFRANSSHLSESKRQRVKEVAEKASLPVNYDFLQYEIEGQIVREWFQNCQIELPAPLDDREYAFGEFIEFHKGWHKPGKATPPRIVIVYGSEPRVTALLHAAHDAASGGEKQEAFCPTQQTHGLMQASAFGHEQDIDLKDLDRGRIKVIEAVLKDQLARQKILETSLRIALGDTQRPINGVSLWDLSFSTAVLFKAALVGAVLEGWKPWPKVRWRLLHISFDGPAFWGQAHHVTDLLGRHQALRDGLDAARDLLEVQYPLGNEVYRDEYGSVFAVPDVKDLLKLRDEANRSLKELLEESFEVHGVLGELTPDIAVSKSYEGKEIELAQTLKNRREKNFSQPTVVAVWWAEGRHRAGAEICTVCGQRPVGYPAQDSSHEQDLGLKSWATQEKAEERNVCRVCLHRRGRRAHDWAHNLKADEEKLGPFECTIWTDEVADENGRLALVVGRFLLDGWLDGKLIPTMRKSASFARIRRCWDTTYQFWREVQNDLIPSHVDEQLRLGIRPSNAEELDLGLWHTYETEIGGRRLGLCWDPNVKESDDRDLLWTTDNLRYQGKQLGIERETLQDNESLTAEWQRLFNGHPRMLYEPSGYGEPGQRAVAILKCCMTIKSVRFKPYVPLLAEPATFMALVPADRALRVAQAIKCKYSREMARVHDRLPLHLGLIFAPRRTPLAAVLEAGRAMLTMSDSWERWQIEARGYNATFSRNGRSFRWTYPAKMGDDETQDVWYPHLLLRDPSDEQVKELTSDDFCRVDDAKLPGTVFLRPSLFDFEFLDTTARRFEIAYDKEGRRVERFIRPFLLNDLDRLKELWNELKFLKRSQRHQIISTIEATREAWFGADTDRESLADGVFRQFVRDTLAGAAWPKGHKWLDISETLRRKLENAGVTGELTDLAELHMEILKEREEDMQ